MEWIYIAKTVVFGSLCGLIANVRGRPPLVWFIIGCALGWIGLLILFILPSSLGVEEPKKEPIVPPPAPTFEPISNWFYLDMKKEVCGPFSADVIKEQWKKGSLSKESWVWNETVVDWKKIDQITSLYEWLTFPEPSTQENNF